MTARPGPKDDNVSAIDVGDEIVPAVILEAQIRSQGIRVTLLDTDNEAPPPFEGRRHRLLVPTKDLPLVLEMLQELQS